VATSTLPQKPFDHLNFGEGIVNSMPLSNETLGLVLIALFVVALVTLVLVAGNPKPSATLMALVAVIVVSVLCVLPYAVSIGQVNILLTPNLNAKQSIGVVASIIGLWLTNIGVLGKKRLERWDGRIVQWMRENKMASWAEGSSRELQSRLSSYLGWLLSAIIVLGLFWLYLHTNNSFIDIVFPLAVFSLFLSLMLRVPLFMVPAIFPYLLYAIIWVLMLPFRLINLIEGQAVFERTLLLSGIILGTVGVLFLAM